MFCWGVGIIEYLQTIKNLFLGVIFIIGLFILYDVIKGKNETQNKIFGKIIIILSPIFLVISLLLNNAYNSGLLSIIFAVIRAYLGIAFVLGAFALWKVIQEYLNRKKQYIED